MDFAFNPAKEILGYFLKRWSLAVQAALVINKWKLKEYFAQKGEIGSFFLGIIFALAFCPFSAVLYFGMLIPLALRVRDPIVLPAVFAFATGLPVIILSILLVYSMSAMGKAMHKMKIFEKITRNILSIIFLVVGIYFIIKLI